MLDVHRFTVSRDEGLTGMARDRGIARELEEYHTQLEQVVPSIIQLVHACRTHRVPVLFTRLVAAPGESVAAQAVVTGFWVPAESPEAGFLPDPQPQADEEVIDKTTTGAFWGTDLDARLRRFGIRYLIICGIQATGAVEQTARAAADLGYGVIVVSDACAADTWITHGTVMTQLVGGLIRVRTTRAVLEMLEGTRT